MEQFSQPNTFETNTPIKKGLKSWLCFHLLCVKGKKVNQELQLRSGTVVYSHQEKLNIPLRKANDVCTNATKNRGCTQNFYQKTIGGVAAYTREATTSTYVLRSQPPGGGGCCTEPSAPI